MNEAQVCHAGNSFSKTSTTGQKEVDVGIKGGPSLLVPSVSLVRDDDPNSSGLMIDADSTGVEDGHESSLTRDILAGLKPQI
jgi:hypothetical protein